MLQTNERFHSAVEQAVERIEQGTDAEIVVVAAARSGSYRDVTFAAASAVALLTLIVLVAVPYPINPWLLVADLIIVWLVAVWLASGRVFLRVLTTSARRHRQCRDASSAEFLAESVHATPHRTGVLIYVSGMEGEVTVVPDLGIQGQIPGPVWAEATEDFHHADLEHFLRGMEKMGAALIEHVPSLEIDLVDLPNAPRVRS